MADDEDRGRSNQDWFARQHPTATILKCEPCHAVIGAENFPPALAAMFNDRHAGCAGKPEDGQTAPVH